jgi:hypothetical protein
MKKFGRNRDKSVFKRILENTVYNGEIATEYTV